jgi:hypothetical protein
VAGLSGSQIRFGLEDDASSELDLARLTVGRHSGDEAEVAGGRAGTLGAAKTGWLSVLKVSTPSKRYFQRHSFPPAGVHGDKRTIWSRFGVQFGKEFGEVFQYSASSLCLSGPTASENLVVDRTRI